jgi:hypothetical protein
MRLRDGNIIVCDCGVEKNPEITLDVDFIKHDAVSNIATCSHCGASGEIVFPTTEIAIPVE